MELEKLPCTSSTIHFHILRAYLQCFHWLHAQFQNKTVLNPTDFGYDFNEEFLIPVTVSPKNILTILHHEVVSSFPDLAEFCKM